MSMVIRDGQIVEQGSFTELLRKRGPFASLYRTQFGLQEEERKFRLLVPQGDTDALKKAKQGL